MADTPIAVPVGSLAIDGAGGGNPVTDTFNRAGPDVGTDWDEFTYQDTLLAEPTIVGSSEIQVDSGTQDAGLLYVDEPVFTADGYIELTVGTIDPFVEAGESPYHTVGGGLRIDDDGSGYFFDVRWSVTDETSLARIFRFSTGGSPVVISSNLNFAASVNEGAKFKFTLTGRALLLQWDSDGVGGYSTLVSGIDFNYTFTEPDSAAVILVAEGGGVQTLTSIDEVTIAFPQTGTPLSVSVTTLSFPSPAAETLALTGYAPTLVVAPAGASTDFLPILIPGALTLAGQAPTAAIRIYSEDGAKTRLERLSIDYGFERVR